jgi:hypothetical protein
MSNAFVFPSQGAALAVAAIVDAQQGYPKPGVDVGGGIHVPPAQSITTTYAVPTSPDGGATWSYPADAVTTAALATPQAATALAAQAVVLPAPTPVAVVTDPVVVQPVTQTPGDLTP